MHNCGNDPVNKIDESGGSQESLMHWLDKYKDFEAYKYALAVAFMAVLLGQIASTIAKADPFGAAIFASMALVEGAAAAYFFAIALGTDPEDARIGATGTTIAADIAGVLSGSSGAGLVGSVSAGIGGTVICISAIYSLELLGAML